MLVLSRTTNEQITITDGTALIRLTVVEVRGDRVRLGVEAPDRFGIFRQEIYDKGRPETSGTVWDRIPFPIGGSNGGES